MKRIALYIRARGDGKYRLLSEFGWGFITNRETGLSEEELIQTVTDMIKGSIQEWKKS